MKIYLIYKPARSIRPRRRGDSPVMKEFLSAERTHRESLKKIGVFLKKKRIPFRMASRIKPVSFKGYDLILTVGGDGTLLKASHRAGEELFLGINSAPGHSVGALCSIQVSDFEKKLDAILAGNFRIQKRARLDCFLNGRRLPDRALNDVLIANNCPAGTSRYRLTLQGCHEDQKSSGIWIATGSGSTGAIRAAGGRPMPATSAKMQYLVREPYRGDRNSYQLVYGILPSEEAIQVTVKTQGASLFIDGMQTIEPLHFGDRLRVCISKKPLNIVV